MLFVTLVPGKRRIDPEGIHAKAVTDIVEEKSAAVDLAFRTALPGKDRARCDRLGGAVHLVVQVVVIAVGIVGGNAELKHKGVHTDLRQKVDHRHRRLLGNGRGIGKGAVAAGGLDAEADRRKPLALGDILAVHPGIEPTAALTAQVFVDRKKHGTGVVTRDDTAILPRVGIQDLVHVGILYVTVRKAEIRKKPNPKADHGGLVIGNVHLPRLGHHHSDIPLKLLGGKVDCRCGRNLVDRKHNCFSNLFV